MSTTKDPLERAKQTLEKLHHQNTELAARLKEQSDLEAHYDKLHEQYKKTDSRLGKMLLRVGDKHSAVHRIAVDLGGGSVAQVSTELINWGVRALGAWSGDGFWAQNVDLLQGGPHFFMGLGAYILEMATRKDPTENLELPSTSREVLSEAAKIFSQLGLNNVVRALRVRWEDGKRLQTDAKALAGMQAEYQKLFTQYKALRDELEQAKKKG